MDQRAGTCHFFENTLLGSGLAEMDQVCGARMGTRLHVRMKSSSGQTCSGPAAISTDRETVVLVATNVAASLTRREQRSLVQTSAYIAIHNEQQLEFNPPPFLSSAML